MGLLNILTILRVRFSEQILPTGPALSSLVIQPLNGSELIEWNLESGTGRPHSTVTWQHKKVYVITYVRGTDDKEFKDNSWTFWLKFDVSYGAHEKVSGGRIRATLSRHFLEHFA